MVCHYTRALCWLGSARILALLHASPVGSMLEVYQRQSFYEIYPPNDWPYRGHLHSCRRLRSDNAPQTTDRLPCGTSRTLSRDNDWPRCYRLAAVNRGLRRRNLEPGPPYD